MEKEGDFKIQSPWSITSTIIIITIQPTEMVRHITMAQEEVGFIIWLLVSGTTTTTTTTIYRLD